MGRCPRVMHSKPIRTSPPLKTMHKPCRPTSPPEVGSEVNRKRFYISGVIKSSIYIYLRCLSVCLFVSKKRQNGWTDRAQILCGISHDPREGLRMIQISKVSLQQNSVYIKFWKYTKIFIKSANFFCFSFTTFTNLQRENVHNWKRRWARSALKA